MNLISIKPYEKDRTVQCTVSKRHYKGRHIEKEVNNETGICLCFIQIFFPSLYKISIQLEQYLHD